MNWTCKQDQVCREVEIPQGCCQVHEVWSMLYLRSLPCHMARGLRGSWGLPPASLPLRSLSSPSLPSITSPMSTGCKAHTHTHTPPTKSPTLGRSPPAEGVRPYKGLTFCLAQDQGNKYKQYLVEDPHITQPLLHDRVWFPRPAEKALGPWPPHPTLHC